MSVRVGASFCFHGQWRGGCVREEEKVNGDDDEDSEQDGLDPTSSTRALGSTGGEDHIEWRALCPVVRSLGVAEVKFAGVSRPHPGASQ